MKDRSYTFPHRSRKDKVDYLLSNGGYGGFNSRPYQYALAYNVKAYNADLTFDHLWEKYASEFVGDILSDKELQDLEVLVQFRGFCKEQYDEIGDALYSLSQEAACSSVMDSDTYAMVYNRNAVEKVTFGFVGRCGGHCVVEEVNGLSLRYSSDVDLEEAFRQDLEALSFQELHTLYSLARQWEVDLTPDHASSEVEYQAAFNFFVNIVAPEYASFKEARLHRTQAELAIDSLREVILKHLSGTPQHDAMNQLATLAQYAGFTEKEVAV